MNIQNGTGDFCTQVIKIADKITNTNEKQDFLDDVPSYIDEFVQTGVGVKASIVDGVWNLFSVVTDVLAGVLLYLLKLIFLVIPGLVGQLVQTLLVNLGAGTGVEWVTFEDIFFNKLALLDIDIFNFSSAAGQTISAGNVLFEIRKNVAGWYYTIRNLCIALSFAVLVYIGIRMAMSSIADDRAKYKKMLKDWLVSLALIFVLHYFMVFVIQLNNGLVDALNNARLAEEAKLEVDTGIAKLPVSVDLQSTLLLDALTPLSFTKSFAAGFVYIMVVAMTFLFIVVYVKRMVTICFLAMIAPIITVTYAIDKAGDGRAQAFDKWMGEFVFNILIQPFHCIIYMTFLQGIFYVINNTTGVLQFGKIIVAVTLLGLIYKAEDIVKSIFGFKTSNLSSAAMLGAAAINRAQSFGKKAKGVKDAGEMAKNIKNMNSPNSLPSQARNIPGGNNNPGGNLPNQGGNAGGTQNNKKSLASRAGKAVLDANKWTAKHVAGKAVSAAVAYGLTGDASKAYAAHTLIQSGKNRIDDAKLKGRINERKELTRDAYQDYAEHKGLDTREARMNEAKRLMEADIDTLTDPAERNMAEWLKAERQMHEAMGSKDAQKDVLRNLSDYEDEIG